MDAQMTSFEGRVSNSNANNKFDFKLVFIQNQKRIDSTVTGVAGFYKKNLPSGIYSIEISQAGFLPTVIKDIDIKNTLSLMNVNLKLQYVPITRPNTYQRTGDRVYRTRDTVKRVEYVDSLGRPIKYFAGVSIVGKETTSKLSKSSTSTYSSSMSKSSKSKRSKKHRAKYKAKKVRKLKGTKAFASAEKSDAVTTTPKTKEVSKIVMIPSISTDESVIYKDVSDVATAPVNAGLVTAGHWRDLDHWKDWDKTNKDPNILMHQNTWQMYPNDILELKFKAKDEKPLSFTKVELYNKRDSLVWETYTDVEGRAYLWPYVFEKRVIEKDCYIKVGEGKTMQKFKQLDKYYNSFSSISTELTSPKQERLELGFMVDATGSMGDEIRFLQNELIDVISRVKKDRPCIDIYTGSVFYKDHGDDYITSVLPLGSNPANTINFISTKSAGGGGDFPEAVDIGLQASIKELGWSSSPCTKILFVLLDAPPHQSVENIKMMQQYTKEAAKLGIRIVPIAASGIDKKTEFLLKYMSIITNGEYLYITDDSKIGHAHLLPTGGRSEVDKLNDIMVNLIKSYSKSDCDPQQEQHLKITIKDSMSNVKQLDSIAQQQQKELVVGNNWDFKYYPNPANNYVFIKWTGDVIDLTITNANGQTVMSHDVKNARELTLDLSSFSSGIYFITMRNQTETASGRLVVIH